MAFLFKSKKAQHGGALPPATRNVHTSEGAPSTAAPAVTNGVKGEGSFSQTPTPSSSYNNSLNSAASPTSPDMVKVRQRAESETLVSGLISSPVTEMTNWITDLDCPSGSTTATAPKWHASTESQLVAIPMVAAAAQFFFTTNKPLSAIWRGYQCRCLKRR